MLKEILKKIPFFGRMAQALYSRFVVQPTFRDSATYWEDRYKAGGNSGPGSYHQPAVYKAAVINQFLADHSVTTVLEFGCGDGNQLQYFQLPLYMGFDVSETAVSRCRTRYKGDPTKRFETMSCYADEKGDLCLSLDVIYHLVEDSVFESYMRYLFSASNRYVIIYANNSDYNGYALQAAHVKNRRFTDWVDKHANDFALIHHIPADTRRIHEGAQNNITDFFFYERKPL